MICFLSVRGRLDCDLFSDRGRLDCDLFSDGGRLDCDLLFICQRKTGL